MADVSVAQLSPRLQKLATQARWAAAQGNHGYAIELSGQILKEVPGCIAVRRLSRGAQLKVAGNSRSIWGQIKGSLLRIKPGEKGSVLNQADAILAADPWSKLGLRQLAAAAKKEGFAETELFAHEALVELAPDDLESAGILAELYLERAKLAEAFVIADRLARSHPQSPVALALFRKVSIAQTMQTGNWGGDGTFRDKLRD
jgi:hypothetical protein